MKARLTYGNSPHGPTYTFEVPNDAQVGDYFLDGDSVLTVVSLGSDYEGWMRELTKRPRVETETFLAKVTTFYGPAGGHKGQIIERVDQ